MQTLRITLTELEVVRKLPISHRRDGLAAFTTNWRGKTWHFTTWGLTPLEKRERIRGCEIVFILARMCREERPGGGRFFVDNRGAFYKEAGRKIRFVHFEFVE